MSRSLIYKFTLFLVMSLGASFGAQALECRDINSNPLNLDTQDIGQLKIPATLPVGSRLWTSKSITVSVSCFAYNYKTKGEPVYYWPNPDNVLIAPGIGIGLIQNGFSTDNFFERLSTGLFRYPLEQVNPPIIGTVTFQVYLKKTGPISDVSASEIPVFQLDGEDGINRTPAANYRFLLTGLDKIEILQCSASVELETPEGIDFGEIPAWSAGDGTVKNKDFTILIRKNGCDDDFKLDVNFTAKDATLTDATGLDMANGATLRIHDNTNPKDIKFNQFDSFADMTGRNQATKSYTASLDATGEAQEGPFKKTVVLLVNYL